LCVHIVAQKVKILAHPSGRLIGRREGYDLDWQKIFKFAKEKNKAGKR